MGDAGRGEDDPPCSRRSRWRRSTSSFQVPLWNAVLGGRLERSEERVEGSLRSCTTLSSVRGKVSGMVGMTLCQPDSASSAESNSSSRARSTSSESRNESSSSYAQLCSVYDRDGMGDAPRRPWAGAYMSSSSVCSISECTKVDLVGDLCVSDCEKLESEPALANSGVRRPPGSDGWLLLMLARAPAGERGWADIQLRQRSTAASASRDAQQP